MTLIKLSNIKKSYIDGRDRHNNVLRGVEMSVEAGEFVAIKGASGSGKTTLLSIVGTLLKPDSGSYLLGNDEMTNANLDLSTVRNRKIGFVFQDHGLIPQYTAIENILLPALALSTQIDEKTMEYAHKLLSITRIENIANQYPRTLSGGEASRVAVCRALVMQPLLLLADEPTGQLDRENARNIAALLTEINEHLHTTIVMVTHSDEVSSVAHRILTLNDGILT